MAKRARTRLQILRVAFEIIGHENARMMNIEEFCATAKIARGTFYNYFTSVEELLAILANELGHALFTAVNSNVAHIPDPALKLITAGRYYFRWATAHPDWAWAMLNASLNGPIYGAEAHDRVRDIIVEGIEKGVFTVSDAALGRDIFAGIGITGTMRLLRGNHPPQYAEDVSKAILQALGVPSSKAGQLVVGSLPELKVPSDGLLQWANDLTVAARPKLSSSRRSVSKKTK